MDEKPLFPSYIRRAEEDLIRLEISRVIDDGMSRAIFLYGSGGIGKTKLVRHLAATSNADPAVEWVDPIDIDDSEYWLLSNLERRVAQRIDPGNLYFNSYFDYLSKLPAPTRSDVGYEAVLSHLGRIKLTFAQCYRNFVEGTGKTVVIVFDAIDLIRGTHLQLAITQWMKALPRTLFILSGRPAGPADDPIEIELSGPHLRVPSRTIWLAELSRDGALEYLQASSIAAGLDMASPRDPAKGPGADKTGYQGESEKQKLVLLTQGHPLWLAFAVDYLAGKGMPDEVDLSQKEIERCLPYGAEMTPAGVVLREEFRRRLVTPYREADFWHESIKRLTVLRQGIDEEIWRLLMADYPLPAGVGLADTWAILRQLPWIRARANGRTVTLHDAVADELAVRIIPLHDQDHHWRRNLWRRAAWIYAQVTDGPEEKLSAELARVDDALRALIPGRHSGEMPATEQSEVIIRVAQLDARKRSLDQLKATRLFYEILSDPEAGCDRFLRLFGDAVVRGDVLFQDLLAVEMQRFLPGAYAHALGNVVGTQIDQVWSWLAMNSDRYLEISLALADYFVEEQPAQALELLDRIEVPAEPADGPSQAGELDRSGNAVDFIRHYRLHIVRGNACLRVPGRVSESRRHFELALNYARSAAVPDQERSRLVATATKELGFYFQSQGMWREADRAYREARDTLLPAMTASSSDNDRAEIASIQTNWAYIKGLTGSYREASNLVESAIAVRRRLGKRLEEASSWSVSGEVYRYERRFQKAWEAFAQAEQMFLELRSWSWLGLIYQEQAICLYQATSDGIELVPGRDSVGEAKRLITLALDICRDQSVRGYPSALNRAGRIFGADESDRGIAYLAEGIEWARRLSDGWFLLTNLVEYLEANYRAWSDTHLPAYLDQIAGRRNELEQALSEYDFPDLKGRWELLQGHLIIRRGWQESGDPSQLTSALEHYKDGFALLAQGYVGSSGASMIPEIFAEFIRHLDEIPNDVRAEWQTQLRREWSLVGAGSTLLLARLEELY
jgi:tetratricopeptide (TPR) repeat protein